ncbi:hypothetical protein SDRG_03364 [Saprolegnia diclina VS20]|uniref:Helicase-associated domain-containing protein n=1 Tax=Saprolegnia diclina (strain VS20) TaxID=1156394 RepID=T0S2G3_SAPDV|nr:hypothetical protein SDRG_03364 [Saprolegnia diclina VS20]EQC39158.1 hypothetical protein SDRG_03364 [Saprolegnia diclina VS20]|eukprot:XP_008607219.1 hypothetical protein SDRG_03364 [Saprolegnia diclina VS20]
MVPTWSWDEMLDALARFRKLHGNCAVPHEFKVPATDAWPSALHGKRLGSFVFALHRRVEIAPHKLWNSLHSLGFKVNWFSATDLHALVNHEHQRLPVNAVIEALATYKKTYRYGAVHVEFQVPKNKSWPEEAHGLALADALAQLHEYELPVDIEASLRVHGCFVTSPPWEQLVGLLEAYQRLHGDFSTVLVDYIVPATTDWPQMWHGLELGCVTWRLGLRLLLLPADYQATFAELGYVFPAHDMWVHVFEAWATYQDLVRSGKLDQPLLPQLGYVVPIDDDLWPPTMAGMRLGYWVRELASAQALYLLAPATVDQLQRMTAPSPEAMAMTVDEARGGSDDHGMSVLDAFSEAECSWGDSESGLSDSELSESELPASELLDSEMETSDAETLVLGDDDDALSTSDGVTTDDDEDDDDEVATRSATEAPAVLTALAAAESAVHDENAMAAPSSDELECKPDPIQLRPRATRSLQTRSAVHSVAARVKEERPSSPRRLRPRLLVNRYRP